MGAARVSRTDVLRRAAALLQQGHVAAAERLCKLVLTTLPDDFDALHLLGFLEAGRERLGDAERYLAHALRINPRSAEAHATLGNVQFARGHLEQALSSLERAIAIKPDSAGVVLSRGNALAALGRHAEALVSYEHALKLAPSLAEALNSRGAALSALGRYEQALTSLEQALAIKPRLFEALNNRSGVLKELGRFDEALRSYDATLEVRPDSPIAHHNRGIVLSAIGRYDEALASYDRAIALAPRLAEAHNNRASTLFSLQRPREALIACDRALAMKPDFAEALHNRGGIRAYFGQHEHAVEDLQRALVLNEKLPFARGALLHSRMHCCDWQAYETELAEVVRDVQAGRRSIEPFAFLGLCESPADQLRCARTWVDAKCPPSATPLWNGERYGHRRIRLAYVSANFHEHPMGRLMADLFERHDRERFETFAISFGPDDSSAMRMRLQAAFDRFIDVKERSDGEIAQLIRDLEIDIAVDRNGYTTNARPGIFALRPAPVQVNYLAYPGSSGAPYIDYVLADRTVIPPQHREWYSENVVELPDSYFVNDTTRRASERVPTREEAGLPNDAFVFCSFNKAYKITPGIFAIWMRLLKRNPGSVLWLIEASSAAQRNLGREAATHDVAHDRLVFAPRLPLEDHLSRHRLADLFLDTLPYNAHTTAIDALWAGVPVVTLEGTTFPARVGASLLQAAGLPELVTRSHAEYESLAFELSSDPVRLAMLRRKLIAERERCALFDSNRFRRNIEEAYVTMWERSERQERPSGFAIETA